jgi:hypothetical protein
MPTLTSRVAGLLIGAALASGLLAADAPHAHAQSPTQGQTAPSGTAAYVTLTASGGATAHGGGLFLAISAAETGATFLLTGLPGEATVTYPSPGGESATLTCTPFRGGTSAICTQRMSGPPPTSGRVTVSAGGQMIAAGDIVSGEPSGTAPDASAVYGVVIAPVGGSPVAGMGIMAADSAEGRPTVLGADFSLINVNGQLTLIVPMANGGFAILQCAPPAGSTIADCGVALPAAPALDMPLLVLAGDDQVASGTVLPPRR